MRLRIRVPDRPGALGAVAARIGSVGGDIRAVEVLGGADDGWVVDELVVRIAPGRRTLLVRELAEVDGLDVVDLEVMDGPGLRTRAGVLRWAAHVRTLTRPGDILAAAVDALSTWMRCSEVTVITESGILARSGAGPCGPDDGSGEVVVPMPPTRMAVRCVRPLPFTPAEAAEIAAVVALAGTSWAAATARHPSAWSPRDAEAVPRDAPGRRLRVIGCVRP